MDNSAHNSPTKVHVTRKPQRRWWHPPPVCCRGIVLAASKLSMPVRLIAEKDTAELNDDVEDFPVRINDLSPSLCLSIPIPLQIR